MSPPTSKSAEDIENLLARAVSEDILVQLEINDGQKTTSRLSLIQEVQHHPVRGEIIRVDFHAVSMNEEIDAEVVLEPRESLSASRPLAVCCSRACACFRFAACPRICRRSSWSTSRV